MNYINYYIGKLLDCAGYHITRRDRIPQYTANLFQLGAALAMFQHESEEPLSIIQIGAFDGLFADGLEPIIRNPGNYMALLVEPQKPAFEKMTTRYSGRPDIKLSNVAISHKDGEIALFSSLSGDSEYASILPAHRGLIRHKSGGLRAFQVPTLTVESLLRSNHIHRADLLMIDTEGYDFEILKQFLRVGVSLPRLIQLESYHLSPSDRMSLRSILSSHGYLYAETNLDTVAFHRSLTEGVTC